MKQETSIFDPREPKDLDSPIDVAMFHVKQARHHCERGQYMRAAAHGSIATATALIAWTLGDPSMTPTIPCTPSAEQRELEIHDDPARQRPAQPVIHAETQEEAWERLRR